MTNWPNEIHGASVQRAVDAQAILALEHSGSNNITEWQTERLIVLIQWLLNKTPAWRERLGPKVDFSEWANLPILSRFELRKMITLHGAAPVPEHHGAVSTMATAGVPGAASHFFMSEFAQRLINHAYYADHQRQGRNPYASHACIADDVPLHDADHLFIAPSQVTGTGPQALRNLDLFNKAQHLQWLNRHQPTYLTVRPDWFEVALVHAAARCEPLPEIRQLLTYGATATDSLRRKARQWLGASVRHRYTCPECGPLAFQCPRSDGHYHVAVANVRLDVVDEAGHPFPDASNKSTAVPGRILVTALHQYATPLLRYDTGDMAALHPHCPGCGLDVPSLSVLRQNV